MVRPASSSGHHAPTAPSPERQVRKVVERNFSWTWFFDIRHCHSLSGHTLVVAANFTSSNLIAGATLRGHWSTWAAEQRYVKYHGNRWTHRLQTTGAVRHWLPRLVKPWSGEATLSATKKTPSLATK